MELIDVSETSFEELDKPETLYKYRDWKDDFHKLLLTDRKVFMAPPSTFKDPLDCKIPIRYDLVTDAELFKHYFEEMKKSHPELTNKERIKLAQNWTQNAPIKNKEFLEKFKKDKFIDYDSRFGVFSITEDPANYKMWDKYSSSLTGFCIGFDSSILFQFLGGGGPVQYVEKLPVIKPFEDYVYQHNKQVFSKLIKWDYEEEYRTHKFWPNPANNEKRNIVVCREAFKEIIFGPKMTSEDKKDVKKAVKESELAVDFSQAEISENKTVTIKPVSEIKLR